MIAAAMSEGPTVAAVAPLDYQANTSPDFRSAGLAEQALQVIEGEDYARGYLDRLHAGTADPDDLAVLMAFLRGPMLRGACGVIEKALRGCHA